MTHLPFVVSAYALGIAVPVVFGMLSWMRLGQARRKLAAIDPRTRS